MSRTLTLLLLLLNVCAPAQQRAIDSIRELIRTAKTRDEALCEKAMLVTKYYAAGMPDQSIALFNEAMAEARQGASDKAWGALYNTKGVLFFYATQLDSSLHYLERSLEYRKKAGDREGMVKSSGNIGNIYTMTGNYEKAREYYESALTLEEELGYETGEILSLNNIATMYRMMNIPKKALHYYQKGEKIYAAKNNLESLSTTFDGMANVYQDIGQADSALYYGRKSKELAERTGDGNGYAYALTNIAITYHHMKKFDSAIATLHEALPITRMVRDKRLELGVYGNMAANFIMQDKLDSALKYIELVIPLQEELNYKEYERDLAKIYAEYYFQKGDYKKGYEYMKMHAMIRDSVYNVEMNAKVADMQEKYETAQKEKRNQVLESENRQHRTTRNYLLLILSLAGISIVGGVVSFTKIRRSNSIIRNQKDQVEEKQKEILDSINYARRIQFALLASEQLLKKYLPQHFVLFLPKSVVSGDFYWANPADDGFMLLAGDCTGHGVPGAFMSLLNITKVNQVISEQRITRPDLVLNKVREEIVKVLNPEGSEESKDGMDAVLCKFSFDKMKLEYAAANNSFYIVRNKRVLTCGADKMPVGKGHDDSLSFTYNELGLEKNDMIYLFTDGFADQFGGPLGKKFKYRQLEQLLLSVSGESMDAQKGLLATAFNKWKGELEQVDDVCVIGVRV